MTKLKANQNREERVLSARAIGRLTGVHESQIRAIGEREKWPGIPNVGDGRRKWRVPLTFVRRRFLDFVEVPATKTKKREQENG